MNQHRPLDDAAGAPDWLDCVEPAIMGGNGNCPLPLRPELPAVATMLTTEHENAAPNPAG